jgi:8-oxo-dGTP diphosphatase
MVYRKGIAAIVFRRKGKKKEFLLFHRIQNWAGWEFPKGGRQGKETEMDCLKREIKEEMGSMDYKVVAKTNYVIKYPWPRKYQKDGKWYDGVVDRLYIVEFFGKKIRYSKDEHSSYLWVGAKKALKMLTYEDQKKALEYALGKYIK